MSRAPLPVVVTAMPASGKTTLARELAARLDLPLVEKDEVKETLFDTLGIGDVEWSQRRRSKSCSRVTASGRLDIPGISTSRAPESSSSATRAAATGHSTSKAN